MIGFKTKTKIKEPEDSRIFKDIQDELYTILRDDDEDNEIKSFQDTWNKVGMISPAIRIQDISNKLLFLIKNDNKNVRELYSCLLDLQIQATLTMTEIRKNNIV